MYVVQYWCQRQRCWRDAMGDDGRPLEYATLAEACLAAGELASSTGRARVVDDSGLVWRYFLYR